MHAESGLGKHNDQAFLTGGGAMGGLLRDKDWSGTSLGDADNWPPSLKYSISMMLSTAFPVLICWGADYIQFYNDAFRPILGATKHPEALAGSAAKTFGEIWETIGPMFAKVMQGETLSFPDFKVPLERNGYTEDCYFDFSYSPIRNEDGSIGGVMVICMETTEKVRAIDNMSISRENLRNTVRQAPVGMCIVKGQPLFVEEVNDAFLGIIGKQREQFDGTPYWVVNAETADMYEPVTDRILSTGETYHARDREVSLIRNGRRESVFVDFVFEPIRSVNGKIEAIMIVAMEVTDKVVARSTIEGNALKVQALNEALEAANEELTATNDDIASVNEELIATNEELTETQTRLEQTINELAESESSLKLAIRFTHLGTWDYDMVYHQLFVSEECREIFGFPLHTLVSFTDFFSCTAPEDQDFVNREIRNLIDNATEGRYDIAYRIIRYDNGTIRWVRVQGTIYFDSEGRAMRHMATVLDISESKWAEEKSAKLAAIVESSDDAILSKTLESVITSWNDSAERMFGYSASEMIGQTIYKLIPEDRYDEEPLILARLKSGERVQHFETKRVTSDGRLIDVSLTISPVKDTAGNIIGLSKIIRDITERKKDEQRKNDFIGMASHELKTPLTSLKAILQILEAKFQDSEDAFTMGAVNKANLQVNRMISMINGFLNVSRLESGKISIEKTRFNLEELIDEVIKETRFTVISHTIHFTPCMPVMVEADYEKISSVITNLISNAVKYSPGQTTIRVDCNPEGANVRVSVTDEGMGISEQDRTRLFERYYRVENKNVGRISGFGIGLYLCSEIIQRHDGTIGVESTEGKGSTFHFTLPVSQDDISAV